MDSELFIRQETETMNEPFETDSTPVLTITQRIEKIKDNIDELNLTKLEDDLLFLTSLIDSAQSQATNTQEEKDNLTESIESMIYLKVLVKVSIQTIKQK